MLIDEVRQIQEDVFMHDSSVYSTKTTRKVLHIGLIASHLSNCRVLKLVDREDPFIDSPDTS
jgi:hypothetical protein